MFSGRLVSLLKACLVSLDSKAAYASYYGFSDPWHNSQSVFVLVLDAILLVEHPIMFIEQSVLLWWEGRTAADMAVEGGPELGNGRKVWKNYAFNFRFKPSSSVNIVSRLRVGRRSFVTWQGQRRGFSSSALGPAQTQIQWVPGLFLQGVKRSGLEADLPPPSCTEVKNVWSYTSTPQFVFMAWCLTKQRMYLHGMVLSLV
jgi:hypothetical protein